MNAKKNFLCVLFIFFTFVLNAQVRTVVGICLDADLINIVNSPEDSNYNFKRSDQVSGFSLGPKIDIGNPAVRLTIEGYGSYRSNKAMLDFFLVDEDEFKTNVSLGYGGSAIFYYTPWYSEPATTLQIGKRVRQQTDGNRKGFSIGAGWENMKTFYKIPKGSNMENKRFDLYYGKVGYCLFSSLFSMNFYFRYGIGENKASMWGIGIELGVNF